MPRVLYVGSDPQVKTELAHSSRFSKLESTDDLMTACLYASELEFDVYVVDRDLASVAVVCFCAVVRELDRGAKIVSLSHDILDKSVALSGMADLFLHKPEDIALLNGSIDNMANGRDRNGLTSKRKQL